MKCNAVQGQTTRCQSESDTYELVRADKMTAAATAAIVQRFNSKRTIYKGYVVYNIPTFNILYIVYSVTYCVFRTTLKRKQLHRRNVCCEDDAASGLRQPPFFCHRCCWWLGRRQRRFRRRRQTASSRGNGRPRFLGRRLRISNATRRRLMPGWRRRWRHWWRRRRRRRRRQQFLLLVRWSRWW